RALEPAERARRRAAAAAGAPADCPPEWASWVARWRDTSTRQPRTRGHDYGSLLQVGRWLAATHPEVTSPERWTRELAAEDVAAGLWATGDKRVAGRKQLPLYPLELVRAVTLVWLFAGLRSDEIRRLRVGCIRWRHTGADGAHVGAPGAAPSQDAVCWLDVP